MKKLLSLACTFVLVTLILLTGCGKKTVPFTIPDFLENALYHTQQEVFSRYGYDEASASAVTPAGSDTELSAAETFSIGGTDVHPQFSFDETGSCVMLRYRIDLSGKDTDAVYETLLAQSAALKEALAFACDFDDPNVSGYTAFPSDTFSSADALSEAIAADPAGTAYNRFWTWILNAYDESESVWSDLMLWFPEGAEDAYLEFRVYRFS